MIFKNPDIMMKKLFLISLFLILFAISIHAQNTFTKKAIDVSAGRYWAAPINVADTFTLSGRFRARGGNENDIEVYVLSRDEFENWKNGHAAVSFYYSGRKSAASFSVNLRSGKYYLVLNNKFSLISDKAVTLTLQK